MFKNFVVMTTKTHKNRCVKVRDCGVMVYALKCVIMGEGVKQFLFKYEPLFYDCCWNCRDLFNFKHRTIKWPNPADFLDNKDVRTNFTENFF